MFATSSSNSLASNSLATEYPVNSQVSFPCSRIDHRHSQQAENDKNVINTNKKFINNNKRGQAEAGNSARILIPKSVRSDTARHRWRDRGNRALAECCEIHEMKIIAADDCRITVRIVNFTVRQQSVVERVARTEESPVKI